jgi:SAM-dependent methyltransferase
MLSKPEDVVPLYARVGAQWVAQRGKTGIEVPWLKRLVAPLAPGADVLDLGCGGGDPIGGWLEASGFSVSGADSAPVMLDLYQKAVPRAEVVLADMRTLSLDRRFDAIVMWDSFFHLSASAQRQALPQICAHLKSGGGILFTCGPKSGEVTGAVVGEPVYHASLEPAEYVALLSAAGLRLEMFVAEDPATDFHTVCLARKIVASRSDSL